MTEGRSCPIAYRYRPESLCASPETVNADVLYIIGGLYGNVAALDEIDRMAAAEMEQGRKVELMFNGDFNWFNASDQLFREVNERVLKHRASLGNVDYELANPNDGAGCGCAYPNFVDQGVVERSNAMMERLQALASGHPDIQDRLNALPRTRCLIFGGLKVLVVHGDPESLAGWGLAWEAFTEGNESQLAKWFADTGADVIASTHTCLPVLWSGEVEGRARLVVNNGAAGMGNLADDARGLITRVVRQSGDSARPDESGPQPVSERTIADVGVSLVPVAFDLHAWLKEFDGLWPAHSPAAISYRDRLAHGTGLSPAEVAFPRSF